MIGETICLLNRQGFQKGFTLLELLVVMVFVGILAAMVSPVWLKLLAEQKTTSARGRIRQDIQLAQSKSQQNNVLWQFSIRDNGETAEVSTHPAATPPDLASWERLNESIQIDDETTLLSTSSVYYVRFDQNGNVRSSRLGRVTVSSKQFPNIKRCVVVSTLIGATRTAKERPLPDPSYRTRDRFCY